jgi:HEAT repeat protein
LESKYAEVRRAALEAIGHHANGSKLEPLVLKRFDDRSPHVVRTACQSAASLGLFSAHDRILSLLNDSSPSTREVAVRALSSVWRPSDFDVVMKCFQKDHSNAVRKEASWTLGQHITKDNWKKLLCVWSTDSIPRHRSWACEIAGEFGSSNIREPLEKLLNDVDGHVRRAAKLALEKL